MRQQGIAGRSRTPYYAPWPWENPARILRNHVPEPEPAPAPALEPAVIDASRSAVEIRSVPRRGLPFPVSALPPACTCGAKWTDSLGLGGGLNRSASWACDTAGEGRKSGGGDAVAERRRSGSSSICIIPGGEGERAGASGSGLLRRDPGWKGRGGDTS